MRKLILYRLAQFPLILAIIYLITFALAWVAPGDPFANERAMDPLVKHNLELRFHADSAWTFLAWYPYNILAHGDFGPSMQYKEWSVNDIIKSSLPVSVTLGMLAVTIALVVGVGIGTLAAVRRGGALDWISLSITLLGISLPSFVTAAVMLMFAAYVRVLPVSGWGSAANLILPGIALSLAPMAYIVRLTRVAMLDTLGADFVRTARAKGVSRTSVIWKHCLRNSFLPVLSFLGPAAAATLTGSFVVEKVFNIPGLGQHFVNSVLNRDRTLILGVVIVYSVFLLTFNLLVDLAYALVDPRINLADGGGK
ncbi:MAG TPA: ABC transporter permease [Tepidisphaeraceae bacterium]|jgi:oligopeptide transport system permease protein|nr:ABC transporter permease [Tepidisphaeraceae bacterium]